MLVHGDAQALPALHLLIERMLPALPRGPWSYDYGTDGILSVQCEIQTEDGTAFIASHGGITIRHSIDESRRPDGDLRPRNLEATIRTPAPAAGPIANTDHETIRRLRIIARMLRVQSRQRPTRIRHAEAVFQETGRLTSAIVAAWGMDDRNTVVHAPTFSSLPRIAWEAFPQEMDVEAIRSWAYGRLVPLVSIHVAKRQDTVSFTMGPRKKFFPPMEDPMDLLRILASVPRHLLP